MRFREHTLLNSPSMMLAILREAAKGPATVASCVEHLQHMLESTGEHTSFTTEDFAIRVRRLKENLVLAHLLTMVSDDGFMITARGRDALHHHPMGFSTGDLMAYPEFADFVRGINKDYARADLRASAFDEGYHAYLAGASPADNPCEPESADHMAWANGWSDALDDDRGYGT